MPHRTVLSRLVATLRPRSEMSLRHAAEAFEAGVGGTLVVKLPSKPGEEPEVFFSTTPVTIVADLWKKAG